ncbi:universal stress protein [Jiella endophytica]|uniref:Universal stress protein n=1 Tax=Jiella endophytica TaxID=2558362 RepID=A0A4Y8RVQ8_9HYPH|nr:universal stress protein [Jiella endophytica]TFF27544.1 universal stress protein [Jiella endophytica]
MQFRTILSVVDVDHWKSDLELARRLGEETGAHLSVFVTSVAEPPPIAEYAAIADVWLREQDKAARRLHEEVEAINAVIAAADLSADVDSVHAERPMITGAVGRRGRYVDLVIVGPKMIADQRLRDVVLEGALFEAESPVLMLPEGAAPTLRPKRVMVAWSSTPEASRAVRQAAEMLGSAEAVDVVLVDPQATSWDAGPEPGADVAAYLVRHGAKVTVERLSSERNKTVEEVLRRHAVDAAADMVVMGAYGHSRLREWLFGGVTQSMTEKPPLPLFLAR